MHNADGFQILSSLLWTLPELCRGCIYHGSIWQQGMTHQQNTQNMLNAHETIMTSYYNFAKLQNPHLSKHLTCQLLLSNCPCISHALPLSLYQTIDKHALKNQSYETLGGWSTLCSNVLLGSNPALSRSHHQDCYVCRFGNPNQKPSRMPRFHLTRG